MRGSSPSPPATLRPSANTNVQRCPDLPFRSHGGRARYNDAVTGHAYRDRVARYIHRSFARFGLVVYTEVPLGKTIIGKNRQLDVFVLRTNDQRAIGLECKYQASVGTTDEKIPYSLQDLEALWIPGALVYAGTGWSTGVLHTLEASRLAVRCEPDDDLRRSRSTIELDHVIASVFGLWDQIIPSTRRLVDDAQLELPAPGFSRVRGKAARSRRHSIDRNGS